MRKLFFIVAITSLVAACNNQPQGEQAQTGEKKEVKQAGNEATAYTVDPSESKMEWLGTKPTGEHYGTVNLASGELSVENNQLTGGSFVIDMTSIVDLDIEDPEMNAKLVNHLKSPDFFNTAEHPEATFEITGVEELSNPKPGDDGVTPTHRISGNLTIKGISKNISFPAKVEMKGTKIKAQTVQFLIDRTQWDVNFKSKSVFDNLKENFIHDEVAITIELVANS